jgi:hypothetical protein
MPDLVHVNVSQYSALHLHLDRGVLSSQFEITLLHRLFRKTICFKSRMIETRSLRRTKMAGYLAPAIFNTH